MANPKVLVIDDEAGPRESLRMILKDNCQVLTADGPIEGLKLAGEHHPDMVFLDIKMPEMDGTEVLRRIKEMDPDIEVALITAFGAVDSAQQALRYGAIDYLTKPFSVRDITGVLDRALERRSERQKQQALLQQLAPTAQALSGQLSALNDQQSGPDQDAILQNLTEAHNSIETQLSKIARLNAIGEIAAEVAHDVNNFLTAILLRIEMLLMNLKQSPQVDADTLRDALQEIVQTARDGAQAVQRISGISKSDPYEPSQYLDINTLVQDVVNISVGQFNNGGRARIRVEAGEVPSIFGSPAALRTAIMNIVINARQALDDDGEVCIRTCAHDGQAVIEVRDSGSGIPPELLDRIIEPFFTTKGETGSGLGLSVARKVVARHDGTLEFDSKLSEGTTVTIRLPIAAESSSKDAMAKVEEPAVTQGVPDVLVVDDDKRTLNSIRASLVGAGLAADGAIEPIRLSGGRPCLQYIVDDRTARRGRGPLQGDAAVCSALHGAAGRRYARPGGDPAAAERGPLPAPPEPGLLVPGLPL